MSHSTHTTGHSKDDLPSQYLGYYSEMVGGLAASVHVCIHMLNIVLGVLGRPKGDSRLFFWFSATQFVHVWQDAWDISAEVFSMSEPSAWRSLVETATSIQGQATRW